MRPSKQSIGEIELDLGRYELRRGGQRVRLEKKPMDLLIYLVSRREQLVSREEIVAKLWRSPLFIETEPNINNVIRKIRTALGDDTVNPRFLETVVGKGYRFVGPVRVVGSRLAPADFGPDGTHWVAPENAVSRTEQSSLAVLPLMVVGKIADDHGMSLGLADTLIMRLGNLPGVDVLPTSAVLGVSADGTPGQCARRLGVRFVVNGAIQMSKGQWRLSMQMFDAYLQSICFARKRDLEVGELSEIGDELAKQIATALNRPLRPVTIQRPPRYSKDPMAYAAFIRGYRLSSSGNPATLEAAAEHFSHAVARDPAFSLAHAALSVVSATRHYELDPASEWLDKAEFHCHRALELDPELPEGHVANAFLLWGPSKNFQHLEAIAELKHALTLQSNQPQAYNRLGTILAHIGLLDRAREMFERARPFHPRKVVSHSIVQVYVWNHEYDLAWETVDRWRRENRDNKYPIYFGAKLAMMTGDLQEAKTLLNEAIQLSPAEPLFLTLQGLHYATRGLAEEALSCVAAACANPKSFGHAHHSHYQIACILALLEKREAAFEWLERSVSSGFACWPFFLRDPDLENIRELPAFEVLVSSLQSKYPDYIGVL
jgi:DNA-binding winged helix-turn-helix (wHTH) protein/tetratricopeptide (TPR) repeat protein